MLCPSPLLARLLAPAALLVLIPEPAGAQPATPAPAQPSVATPSCTPRQGSLSFIGCSLAEQLALGPSASAASVTVVDLKTDRELPTPAALRERVQAAVSAALGPRSADAKPSELRKLRVELSIEKTGGVLRVRADVRRATGLWQRIRHAKPSAERHGFVEAPLDAELKALIPPPPLVVSEVLKLKAPERGIVALACGPLGSDGGQELALVSRGNVRVGRVVGRAFAERKRASWASLSAISPAPLREPIASAEITAQGLLRVGLTDRKDGLELSRDLGVVARFPGLLPAPGGGCVERGPLGLLARWGSCAGTGSSSTQPTTLDAIAGQNGTQLGRDQVSGKLSLAHPELGLAQNRVGAQLALGDADSDGAPDLAFSADTLDAARDRLTLVTLESNKLVPRFELPATGITAVAICARREGPGMAPVVMATGDELWLIR